MRVFLLIALLVFSLKAVDITFVPTLSSNPTSGTGFGVMSSIIYQADKESSPSQAIFLAQYTNTDSYNVFAINSMFFDSDKYISNTVAGYVFNNSSFDLSSAIPISIENSDANFQANALIFQEQLMVLVFEHFYAGGQFFYTQQKFSSNNTIGALFLALKGIEDSNNGALGLVANYDTRSKKEKFYPRDASLHELKFYYYPTSFGNFEEFSTAEINMRKYIHAFKESDVLAMQVYTKVCSPNTPDASLSSLGINNILRGFSIGQYKARNMFASQLEYRYELDESNFKFTTFAGAAYLAGGSKGTEVGSRDADNGAYGSFGVGVHYLIQKEAGIDYRVDLVSTSKNEQSIYATVNQAF